MAILGVEWYDFVVYSNGCIAVDWILASWLRLLENSLGKATTF